MPSVHYRGRSAAALAGVAGLLAPVLPLTPAFAANVEDCGEEPTGGTLTLVGDICQLTFASAGTFTFTVPSGVEGLYALLVGAGGGAFFDSSSALGYAGDGGEVQYVDYSSAGAGDVFSITTGTGGATDPPAGGGASSVTFDGVTAAASGGAKGVMQTDNYCEPTSGFNQASTGDGAGGASTDSGSSCSAGPGVNPSEGDLDSDGTAVPTIFQTLNTEFGAGGQVYFGPDPFPSIVDGLGHGAGVYSASPLDAHARGVSGGVIFRFTADSAETSNPESSTSSRDTEETRVATAAIHLDILSSPGDRCADVRVLQYGEGLAASSPTTVVLKETSRALNAGKTSPAGNFSAESPLPSDLQAGTYTAVFSAQAPDGSALQLTKSFTVNEQCELVGVNASSSNILARTGPSDAKKWALWSSFGLLVLGASMTLGSMFSRRPLDVTKSQ